MQQEVWFIKIDFRNDLCTERLLYMGISKTENIISVQLIVFKETEIQKSMLNIQKVVESCFRSELKFSFGTSEKLFTGYEGTFKLFSHFKKVCRLGNK